MSASIAFRKPGSKKVRAQRVRKASESEEAAEDAPTVSNEPEAVKPAESDDEDLHVIFETGKKQAPAAMFSFDTEEGTDVNFKVKKSDQKKRILKHAKKLKALEAEEQARRHESEIQIIEKKPIQPKPEVVTDPVILADFQEDHETRARFGGFEDIPDAKAIYEAKKRRDEMRRNGTKQKLQGQTADGYIPLTEPDSSKNVRERLVREDENDMSDEDTENPTGQFYSKSLLISEEERRRREQEEMMYGDVSDESINGDADENEEAARQKAESDEEFNEWENAQIRKGVRNHTVKQMRSDNCAVNNEIPLEEGEEDMDIEIVEPTPTTRAPTFSNTPAINLKSIIDSLKLKIEDKQNYIALQELDLERKTVSIAENEKAIAGIQADDPVLQEKYRVYQEMKLYVRDLLDCIDEKFEAVADIETRIMEMWKARTDKLIKRRRADIEDENLRCKDIADGRPWRPKPEVTLRETDRQNRRTNRSMQRKMASINDHNDGLSSDEDEPESDQHKYRKTIGDGLQQAALLFYDAAEEYCDVGAIMNKFVDWMLVDQKDFDDAYVAICLPKLLSPFIRLELLDWNPLRDASRPLHLYDWYQRLLTVGTDKVGFDLENPVIVGLIPAIVDKLFVPRLTKIVKEQWDPFSMSQTRNLTYVISTLIDEAPTLKSGSKHVQNLLKAIVDRFTAVCENDTFVPIFGKAAIANTASGCSDFLSRRFWSLVKLMRSANLFNRILSQSALQKLILDGLICRNGVFALQLSPKDQISTLKRAIAVIDEIPVEWLPPADPTPYKSLVNVLNSIISEAPSNMESLGMRVKIQKFISTIEN